MGGCFGRWSRWCPGSAAHPADYIRSLYFCANVGNRARVSCVFAHVHQVMIVARNGGTEVGGPKRDGRELLR